MMERLRVGLLVFLVLGMVQLCRAGIIADFDSSAAGEDHSAANLNAGTVGGTWTVLQPGGLNSEGFNAREKIEAYSDAAANNQFQLDGPRLDQTAGGSRSTAFDFKLDLTSAVALGGGNILSLDAAIRRAGAGMSSQRDGLIVGYDADGDTLFELIIDGVNAASRGTIGLVGQTASSEKINFVNPNNPIATTDMTTISIALGASSFDVVVGGETAYSGIAYTDAVTDLSGIQFTATGPDAGYAGYSIDNIAIVPEPATLCLLGVGALLGLKRRK